MPPLKITILGAGISGLTAAVALRQKGHHVTLLERSDFHQEAGAAIHLGPNCSGILQRLGFDAEKAGANLLTGWTQFKDNGEVMMNMDLVEVNKQWKNPWLLIHRIDLHRELKRLAMDPEGEGPVPELLLGCKVVDVDVESGVVKLEDSRTFESDVVVGADGNHSFGRTRVDANAKEHVWGKASYRWVVDRKTLLADPEIKEIVGGEGWFSEFTGNDRRIVMYPCRHNEMTNFVAFVPNEEANTGESGSNQLDNKAVIVKAFAKFSQGIRKLLSYAPGDTGYWQLYDMDTMQKWSKGRLAVIGDAAHPFLPFLGQGGAMAIEDAASVAQVLPEDTPVSNVSGRLKLYERIRHERVTYIQEQTRINGMDEYKRPAVKGGFTMLLYCHNHDEWEKSREKLEESLQDRHKVNGV